MTEEKSRLERWQDNIRVLDLPSGLDVVVRQLDVLSLMSVGNNGAPNPLMKAISENMGDNAKKGIDLQQAIKDNPQALESMSNMLRDMCLRAVIDPPLTENKHDPDKSISVDMIPLTDKLQIFMELMGGEQVTSAERFLEKHRESMVVAPDGGTVPDESEPDDGD